MKDKFKVHDGGAKTPILPVVDPLAQAVILGDDVPKNPIARVFAEDLVEEKALVSTGATHFFVSRKDGAEWGSFSKDRDVLAISVLAAEDSEGVVWRPLVCVRVVIRLRSDKPEGFKVLDGCTRGDGSTIPLPGRVFPVDTPLGRLLHCPIKAKDDVRVEVFAPGFEGARVRVVLHTMRADTV